MYRSTRIASLMLLLMAISGICSADCIPNGHRGVNHVIRFKGLDRFEGYRFALYMCYPVNIPVREVTEGQAISLYNSRPSLYALKDGWPQADASGAVEGFGWEKHPQSKRISFVNSVRNSDPTYRIESVYRVVEIRGGQLILEKVSERSLDRAGNPVVGLWCTAPGPPRWTDLGDPFEMTRGEAGVLVGASMLALLGLLFLTSRRRRNKSAASA